MNPIIGKIQKLFTTAADPAATPAEAATALRIAEKLMFAHRIDQAAIEAHARNESREAGEVRAEDMRSEVLGPKKDRADGWLAMAVGATCNVGVYHSNNRALFGYGLPCDLAIARELFVWVAAKMRTKRKAFCKGRSIQASTLEGRSFATGFALELLERAKRSSAERARSVETVPVPDAPVGHALILIVGQVEEQHQRALARYSKEKLNLGRARSRRTSFDSCAGACGRAAASKVSLSKAVVR